jgi:hypothetical protein
MRAATEGYNGACVGTTRFLRPEPYSRLKHIVSDVTFSIPWHRTEGTKSQSSDHQERRLLPAFGETIIKREEQEHETVEHK